VTAALQPLVLMTAGGTGGHVYPALAVAVELVARGLRVEWVGTARGLEHRVVPAAGITLHCLPVRRNVVVTDAVLNSQRSAVVLRVELGLGYREIADAIGSPSDNAARMTVTRAIERMAEVMDER